MKKKMKIQAAVLALSAVIFFVFPQKIFSEEKPILSASGFVLDNPNLLRRVSLALNDTNIVDAIVYLGEKAEINVAIAKTVQGRATPKDASYADLLSSLNVSVWWPATLKIRILEN